MQVTKFKAPQYTIAARVVPPGDKTLKPGPGAHSPEKVWAAKGCREGGGRRPGPDWLRREMGLWGGGWGAGPSQLLLPQVTVTKPCAPIVTFGIKHSDYMTPLILQVD